MQLHPSVPACWRNLSSNPCCEGCDDDLCCRMPELIWPLWLEAQQPCAKFGQGACDTAADALQGEAMLAARALSVSLRAGLSQEIIALMTLIFQRLLLLSVIGAMAWLHPIAEAMQAAVLEAARQPTEGKDGNTHRDPDPCYCGHALGMYPAVKTTLLELTTVAPLRDRLQNPADWVYSIISVQDCRVMEPAASWPLQRMLHSTLESECTPSFVSSVLFCAQQKLMRGDPVSALRFALAAFVGSSLVPRCLTGARFGPRSTWPFTLEDTARHFNKIWHVLMHSGDPLDAVWDALPTHGRDEPLPSSPCVQEVAPACVLGGRLHAAASGVKFCDEEGLRTLRSVGPPGEPPPLPTERRGWLLPVARPCRWSKACRCRAVAADGPRSSGDPRGLAHAFFAVCRAVGSRGAVGERSGRVLRHSARGSGPPPGHQRLRRAREAVALPRAGSCSRCEVAAGRGRAAGLVGGGGGAARATEPDAQSLRPRTGRGPRTLAWPRRALAAAGRRHSCKARLCGGAPRPAGVGCRGLRPDRAHRAAGCTHLGCTSSWARTVARWLSAPFCRRERR
mmetsp:Transcript_59836/g.195328  ORF Transcript_59836/g.195328 Transcript_59836/m.195328 type:complete len:565 (-) Transcript_59836:539-2233(-)